MDRNERLGEDGQCQAKRRKGERERDAGVMLGYGSGKETNE
jgi:hypothetical protein